MHAWSDIHGKVRAFLVNPLTFVDATMDTSKLRFNKAQYEVIFIYQCSVIKLELIFVCQPWKHKNVTKQRYCEIDIT